MKAILVIDDMPECCFACPCYDRSDYADGCLAIDGGRRSTTHAPWARREAWCPLNPLPTEFKTYKLSPRDQDETELFINMAMIKVYADGYNACLKEIEE